MPTLACQNCFASPDNLLHCKDCKHASYCSLECARQTREHIGCSDTGKQADYFGASTTQDGCSALVLDLQFGNPTPRQQRAEAFLFAKRQRLQTLFSLVSDLQLVKAPNVLRLLNNLAVAELRLRTFEQADFKSSLQQNSRNRSVDMTLDELKTYADLFSKFTGAFQLFMINMFRLFNENAQATKHGAVKQIRAMLEELLHGVRLMRRERTTSRRVVDILGRLSRFIRETIVLPLADRANKLVGWCSRVMSTVVVNAFSEPQHRARAMQLTLHAYETRARMNPFSLLDDKASARQSMLAYWLRKLAKFVTAYMSNLDPDASMKLFQLTREERGLRSNELYHELNNATNVRMLAHCLWGLTEGSLMYADAALLGFLAGPACTLHVNALDRLYPYVSDVFAPKATLATAKRDSEMVLDQAREVRHPLTSDLQAAQERFTAATQTAENAMTQRLSTLFTDADYGKHQWQALREMGRFVTESDYTPEVGMLPDLFDPSVRELSAAHLQLTELMAEIEYDFLDDEEAEEAEEGDQSTAFAETLLVNNGARGRGKASTAKPKRDRSASPERRRKAKKSLATIEKELAKNIEEEQGQGRAAAAKTARQAANRAERDAVLSESPDVTPETRHNAAQRFKKLTPARRLAIRTGRAVKDAVSWMKIHPYKTAAIATAVVVGVGVTGYLLHSAATAALVDGAAQGAIGSSVSSVVSDTVQERICSPIAMRAEMWAQCLSNGICQASDQLVRNIADHQFTAEFNHAFEVTRDLATSSAVSFWEHINFEPSVMVNLPEVPDPYNFSLDITTRAIAICLRKPEWTAGMAARIASQLQYCVANSITVSQWTLGFAKSLGVAIPAMLGNKPPIISGRAAAAMLGLNTFYTAPTEMPGNVSLVPPEYLGAMQPVSIYQIEDYCFKKLEQSTANSTNDFSVSVLNQTSGYLSSFWEGTSEFGRTAWSSFFNEWASWDGDTFTALGIILFCVSVLILTGTPKDRSASHISISLIVSAITLIAWLLTTFAIVAPTYQTATFSFFAWWSDQTEAAALTIITALASAAAYKFKVTVATQLAVSAGAVGIVPTIYGLANSWIPAVVFDGAKALVNGTVRLIRPAQIHLIETGKVKLPPRQLIKPRREPPTVVDDSSDDEDTEEESEEEVKPRRSTLDPIIPLREYMNQAALNSVQHKTVPVGSQLVRSGDRARFVPKTEQKPVARQLDSKTRLEGIQLVAYETLEQSMERMWRESPFRPSPKRDIRPGPRRSLTVKPETKPETKPAIVVDL